MERLEIKRAWIEKGHPMLLLDVQGVGPCWTDFHRGWFDDGFIAIRSERPELDAYLEGGFSQDPVLVALCRMWSADHEAEPIPLEKEYPIPSLPEAEAFNASWRRLTEVGEYASPQHMTRLWAEAGPFALI